MAKGVELSRRIQAITAVAARWEDPDDAGRSQAVEQLLAGGEPYTEEGLAFALNHLMHHLTEEALQAHTHVPQSESQTITLTTEDHAPLALFPAVLALVLRGHRAHVNANHPTLVLLRAFWDEVAVAGDHDVILGDGTESTSVIAVSKKQAVAILDGKEQRQARENLAEDVLLHDGQADANVALIWAPEALAPDAYLEAFAQFRAIFPVHSRTTGRLKMQQAFLKAQDAPHAYGEGWEFLLSKGEPAFQPAGHVRWVPYASLAEVKVWLGERKEALSYIAARKPFVQLSDVPTIGLGMTHRRIWYETTAWYTVVDTLTKR